MILPAPIIRFVPYLALLVIGLFVAERFLGTAGTPVDTALILDTETAQNFEQNPQPSIVAQNQKPSQASSQFSTHKSKAANTIAVFSTSPISQPSPPEETSPSPFSISPSPNSMVSSSPIVQSAGITSRPAVTSILTPGASATTPTSSPAPGAGATNAKAVINEIAWMGTLAEASDEWLELYNPTDSDVDISGWRLRSLDDSPNIVFPQDTHIIAGGYFLIERTDDNTVSNISADLVTSFGKGGLKNTGEQLELLDQNNNVVDVVGQEGIMWYGGNNTEKASMERLDPFKNGNDKSNWQSFASSNTNSKDKNGNAILGSPKARNSVKN